MEIFPGVLQQFQKRLAGEAVSDLAGMLSGSIPAKERALLRQCAQRQCVFTPMATFWNFLAQVLSPGQACRETLRQIQAGRHRRGKSSISSSTGGYCQARLRLPETILQNIWEAVGRQLTPAVSPAMRWMGMNVAVVDGTTISMPDTAQNQAVWPQPSAQKPGCGFPVMKLVGIFSLATGALHSLITGTLHNAEHALFVQLWAKLTAGFDLLLGDRNFGSYATFCALQISGLQGVFRLHQGRKVDWHRARRLGKFDRIFTWGKPTKIFWWLPLPIPDSISIRVLKVYVPIPGFRTHVVFLATTLLDPKLFPAQALADLYLRRWKVELFLRYIKTAMHMDVLRCLSPEMIRRELHMHMIAYNLIRALMLQAALANGADLNRISFKGTCDILRQWAPHLALVAKTPPAYRCLCRKLLATLAEDLLPSRPNRSEPRAVKRRKKNYHLLTKPRHQMGNLPHRNRPT